MISSVKRIAASRSHKFKYALCKINIGDGGCKHWMMVRGQPPKTGGEWHCLWKYIDWGYHRGKLNILAEDKFMVAHVRLSYLWRTWKGGWLWYRVKIVDIPLSSNTVLEFILDCEWVINTLVRNNNCTKLRKSKKIEKTKNNIVRF